MTSTGYVAVDSHTGAYTLVAGDASKLILLPGDAAITVPSGVFAQNDRIDFMATSGTTHTFTAGSGVRSIHPGTADELWVIYRLRFVHSLGGTEIFFVNGGQFWSLLATPTSSTLVNLSSVPGMSIGDALDSLKATTNGLSIPIVPMLGTAGWTGGITDDYSGVGTGGVIGVALPLYPNLALTTVYVSIEPNTGHGGVLPAGMPAASVYVTSPFAHAAAGITAGPVVDASPFAAVYENQHTLTINLGTPLTTGNAQTAWLRLNDETGVAGLRLKWVSAIYA